MKSSILLTSMAGLLVISGSNAMQFKPFIGATMGLQEVSYSDRIENIAREDRTDLPNDFFTYGLEGGVRFGEHSKMYNGGISINADATSASSVEDKFTNAKIADITTFNLSATYDNYFRISGDKTNRIDLVLGAGFGTMSYDIDYKNATIKDETIYSPTVAFKLGLDFELTKYLTLSATTRLFLPTRSHYDIETTYVIGGAVKYML